MRQLILAADLGASKILTAVLDSGGRILMQEKNPTPCDQDPVAVLNQICASLLSLKLRVWQEGDQVKGAAAAVPGPLAFPAAVMLDSPNLGWKEVPVSDIMTEGLGMPVIIEKDTNMAALGEYYFGSTPFSPNLIYITVSTGVGGGLIIDGRLYRGQSGGAGEIGHMVVERNGPVCGCGRQGCLEAVAAGRAISRRVEEMKANGWGVDMDLGPGPWGARELGEAARRGDQAALAVVRETARFLGQAIANLVNLFNPQVVVLGGSVAQGWRDLIKASLDEQVRSMVFSLNARELRIEFTDLGEAIGLFGCLAAVLHKERETRI
ncbi:MAG: ROK family protein [Syntrophomonadaceae bacterium]